MNDPVARLSALLDLERLDDNLFRSPTQEEGWKRVYGGQVLGQALVAAQRTVEAERAVHSIHAYFVLPGDPKASIIYQTERTRDGRSFTTRRVVAIQHGRPIFNLTASFQVAETGFDHQDTMPDVPGPDGLADDLTILRADAHLIPEPMRAFWLRPRAVEVRPVDARGPFNSTAVEPRRAVWFRAAGPFTGDDAVQRAALAYISDNALVGTSVLPHAQAPFDAKLQIASLDHAMWFHTAVRVDEWHLYTLHSPRAVGARGLAFGAIYTRQGQLVASVAQEGLIRRQA